ncbi:hypothetical protein Hypma_002278 [Hypsizygus marmoreus]|uniref:Uncharacterized protein n=1 Tax=Hypsizygus marmoreus TaxID=39966 RepID=A0A369K326_HYPMA|nr:hypothetical protein Hypma_002278 [Hypsizygus marmoreus]
MSTLLHNNHNDQHATQPLPAAPHQSAASKLSPQKKTDPKSPSIRTSDFERHLVGFSITTPLTFFTVLPRILPQSHGASHDPDSDMSRPRLRTFTFHT